MSDTYHIQHNTPLGPVFILMQGNKIKALNFSAQSTLAPPPGASHGAWVQKITQSIDDYFSGATKTFGLDYALEGSEFQQQVWQALQSIPYGQKLSYQAIAKRLGRPQSVRAVASAIGKNPLLILIPCHRVIGKDGALRGYAGGLEIKAQLLAHEALHC